MTRRSRSALALFAVFATVCTAVSAEAPVSDELRTLELGDTAKDVEFQPLEGDKIKLSQLAKQGPVVLVVLRGYPGYQCPLCSRQVAEFRKHAEEFKKLNAKVVLIYPGTAEKLRERAEEFLAGKELPEPLLLAIDPGYGFTSRYGLRWDAPGETAYPSAFVIDEQRTVKFRKVSRTHGDRASAKEVIAALSKMPAT